MNITEANRIFRRSIIVGFFEPRLMGLGFERSSERHPAIGGGGLVRSDLLHVFFDVETGSDYPDGDEWFIADMLLPHDAGLPGSLKGADYFAAIPAGGRTLWHHREMIRYKHGRSQKLDDALGFLESKYAELSGLLEPLRGDIS